MNFQLEYLSHVMEDSGRRTLEGRGFNILGSEYENSLLERSREFSKEKLILLTEEFVSLKATSNERPPPRWWPKVKWATTVHERWETCEAYCINHAYKSYRQAHNKTQASQWKQKYLFARNLATMIKTTAKCTMPEHNKTVCRCIKRTQWKLSSDRNREGQCLVKNSQVPFTLARWKPHQPESPGISTIVEMS